jgi:hypothetical protein
MVYAAFQHLHPCAVREAPLWSAQVHISRGMRLRGAKVKILKRRDFHDR